MLAGGDGNKGHTGLAQAVHSCSSASINAIDFILVGIVQFLHLFFVGFAYGLCCCHGSVHSIDLGQLVELPPVMPRSAEPDTKRQCACYQRYLPV